MIPINKHRFLTELSKFLTFLSDDEREQILMKFGEIFDVAPNQEELAAALVSPLKVTVELSRAYSKDGIDGALERSVELSGLDLPASVSIPAEPAPAPAEVAATPEIPVSPMTDVPVSDTAQAAAPAEDTAVSEAPVDSAPGEETPVDDIYDSIGSAVEEAYANSEDAAALAGANTEAAEKSALPKSVSPAQAPAVTPKAQEKDSRDSGSAHSQGETKHREKEKHDSRREKRDRFEDLQYDAPEPLPEQVDAPVTRLKVKPFALIPYIIVSVPVTIVVIAVLLCLSLAILAVAASAIGSGIFAFSLAFSGMTMFSDIIMTIGMALVCFALGVTLLWGAVWFAVWSIGGFVRGAVGLGRKWCCKEVAIQ